MHDQSIFRPDLPEGWCYPDAEEADLLYTERQRELPTGHLLFGVPVQTFATCEGADDVLFQHRDKPQRFTVIHLTYLGSTEIDADHPTVEFDGSFAEFLAEQEELYGVRPPRPTKG
jgi:hypothetical protein